MILIFPINLEFVHTNTILSLAVQKFIFETKRFPNLICDNIFRKRSSIIPLEFFDLIIELK